MNDIITNVPELALVRACADADIPDDGSVVVHAVNGKPIAFARRSPGDADVVAFQSRCPHMQAPLRFGRVVGGEVVCPWHFFRFDTTTGETVTCPESLMHLRIYPVDRSGDDIYVLVERE